MANINLYNCDCLDYMKKCSDKQYDLAIVDPPYGLGIDGQKKQLCKNTKHNRKEHIFKNWDNSIPTKEYFDELFRISKNQIIWGANYFVKYINNPTKGWIVWYKGQEGLTMSDAELAYSSLTIPTRVIKINRIELLKENTIHPTQKPVKLYKWLLTNYAKQGDKILDTHLGSGSIAIACYDLGFDLDGCELDPEYYNAATKRFETHKKQLTLF